MPRQAKQRELTLNLKPTTDTSGSSSLPDTSPINVDLSTFGGDFSSTGGSQLTSLPPLPSSPPTSPRQHNRDPSKNFLNNFRSRQSPEQQQQRGQIRQVRDEDDAYRPGNSSMSKIYHLRKNPGSTPELSLVGSAESVGKAADGKWK